MARRRSAYVRAGLVLALLTVIGAPASASAAEPVLCETSEATIVGTEGPDELVGLAGVDVIAGLGGDDHITGDLAGDLLCAGEGNDTVVALGPFRALGGPGDDHVETTGGGKLYDQANLYGDEGDDTLIGLGWANLYGGVGDDSLLGGASTNSMYPGLGRDIVDGGDGEDNLKMEQDAGPAEVNLSRGFTKGQGRDSITSMENIAGTPYGDRLIGDDGPNVISVYYTYGPEPDVLSGRGGDDRLLGAAGTMLGGRGDDEIQPRSCCGDLRDDHFDGGAGYDWINFYASEGPITLDLEAGTATGEHVGNDVALRFEAVHGTSSGDTLLGTDADDQLDGWEGNDLLDGRGGNDNLRGLSEDDSLFGGPGDDVLDGGKNTNTVNGGPGVDTCYRGTRTSCER